MARELRFDVSALDQASKTFARMATAVTAFEKRLDKLDGKRVEAEVGVKTDKAERQIGAFATNLRRKLDAATKALPEIEIGADSSEADREIDSIRQELATLRDATIGVDLDADEAERRITEVGARLQKLASESPNVQVRADAAQAMASLGIVNAEVDKLDGRTARIKVDVDRGTGDAVIQLSRLAAALRSFALPGALVAAAPQVAALGAAAVTTSGALWLLPAAANAAGLAVGTLVVGFNNFGDAVGDDPKKAAEAMAKLAPPAREAATAVRSLAPAWGELQQKVQGELFEDAATHIRALGGTYIPILSDSMSRTAEAFQRGATQAAVFLQRSSTVDTVRRMFADLDDTVENLVSGTLGPLTSAFTDMGSVGAKVLADVTSGAGAAAERFAAFITQARGTGQLESWMRGGLNALKQLGQITGNVGASLGAMFRAGEAASGNLLSSLVNVTGRMREFLSSAQGQQAMVTIFENINRVVSALTPGLAAAGRALGQMATSESTAAALEAIATALSRLVEAAAPAIVALSGFAASAIRPLAGALGGLAPVIGPVIGALVALKLAGKAVSFVGMITGLTTLKAAATGIAGSVNSARTAVATMGTSAAAAGTAVAGAGTKAAGSAGKFRTAVAAMTGLSTGAVGVIAPLAAGGVALYGIGEAANSGAVGMNEMRDAVKAGGPALDEMRQKVTEQSAVVGDGLIPVLDRAGAAFDDWWNSNIHGVATTGDLNKAVEEQRQKIEAAAQAAGVSVGTYELMNGALDRSTAAAQQVTDNLARIGPAMSGIKDGVAPTKEMQAALDATGASARTAAQDAGLSAQALGGVGAGADQAAVSMQASRDAFIATATDAGMTQDAAAKLADSLGLIPATARTDFETNAATTAMEVQQVSEKLAEVPVGKSVTVNAMTDTAMSALSGLGVSVERLPDGKVKVTADTAQAQANMAAFINGTRDQRADIQINGQTAPAATALQNVLSLVAAGRETINIDGNDQPARGVLSHLLGMVQGKNVMIEIGGNPVPAEQVVNGLIQAIDTKSPMVDIGGNKIPFDQVISSLAANTGTPVVKDIHGNPQPLLAALPGLQSTVGASPGQMPILVGHNALPGGILNNQNLAAGSPAQQPLAPGTNTVPPALSANQGLAGGALANQPIGPGANGLPGAILGNQGLAAGSTAIQPLDGNPAPANAKIHGVVGLAGQSTGTLTIDGNPSAANGKITTAVRFADGSRGTITVDANPQPANGRITATVTYANGSTGTVTVNANDGAARAAISALQRPTSSTHTVTVRYNDRPFRPGAGLTTRAAGAYATARAKGGYAEPAYMANGGMRSMSPSRAEVVPPRQPRIIGDRMMGDEAFIPVNRSKRSKAILLRTAQEMGYGLTPLGGKAMADGGMLSAAKAILARMSAGQPIYEDWSWKGAPAHVSRHNDALLDELKRRGFRHADGRRFLEDYVRRASATLAAPARPAATQAAQAVRGAQASTASAQSSAVAGIAELRALIAEARAHTGLLRSLRGDLGRGQGWPEVVGQLQQLGRFLQQAGREPATQRAAGARDTAALGEWM